MLHRLLGAAGFTAAGVLVLMIPLQAKMVQLSSRLLKASLARTDERSKLETELLSGADVVKCYSWEVGGPPHPAFLLRGGRVGGGKAVAAGCLGKATHHPPKPSNRRTRS